MRDFVMAGAGALLGALIAMVLMFQAGAIGLVPAASGDMIRAYMLGHPELVAQMNDLAQQRQQASGQIHHGPDIDVDHFELVRKIGLRKPAV